METPVTLELRLHLNTGKILRMTISENIGKFVENFDDFMDEARDGGFFILSHGWGVQSVPFRSVSYVEYVANDAPF